MQQLTIARGGHLSHSAFFFNHDVQPSPKQSVLALPHQHILYKLAPLAVNSILFHKLVDYPHWSAATVLPFMFLTRNSCEKRWLIPLSSPLSLEVRNQLDRPKMTQEMHPMTKAHLANVCSQSNWSDIIQRTGKKRKRYRKVGSNKNGKCSWPTPPKILKPLWILFQHRNVWPST